MFINKPLLGDFQSLFNLSFGLQNQITNDFELKSERVDERLTNPYLFLQYVGRCL